MFRGVVRDGRVRVWFPGRRLRRISQFVTVMGTLLGFAITVSGGIGDEVIGQKYWSVHSHHPIARHSAFAFWTHFR